MGAPKRIPLFDLQRQHRELAPELESAFQRVLRSGRFILGPETEALEQEFAAWCGTDHGIACASGSAALWLALHAIGVQPGDEVITTPFTFIATVEAILLVGARPVFVDVDPETAWLDLDQLEAHITPRTVAVIPVHLYGHIGDMDRLRWICDRYGLAIIEDACQAHGARFRGRRAGTLGHIACFSFYPTKNWGGLGDAGMVITADPDLARRCRMLRNHGRSTHHEHLLTGFNFRMDEFQAAFLRTKLRHVDRWIARRNQIVRTYREATAHHPALHWIPPVAESEPAWHLAVVRSPYRDRLRAWLRDRGIESGVYYDRPAPLQPALRFLEIRPEDIPMAMRWSREVLAVPLFPEMTEDEVSAVAHALAAFSET